MTNFLALDHVEKIFFEYAKTHLGFNEPIPSFQSRFPHQLETALLASQLSFEGKFVHSTIERQGAVLFYELVKLHPFINGNKRIATVSLMTFLVLNGFWLETNWKELYDIAVTVAGSPTLHREGVLRLLEEFIKNKLVPAPQ